jgi:hypothetical protein
MVTVFPGPGTYFGPNLVRARAGADQYPSELDLEPEPNLAPVPGRRESIDTVSL